MEPTTVVWFRRDLRIDDNPALVAASRIGKVVPVFVWSPLEEGQFHPGRVSRWWLKQSLTHLSCSLYSLGTPLILRTSNNTFGVLLDIVRATGATQLFYNHLYGEQPLLLPSFISVDGHNNLHDWCVAYTCAPDTSPQLLRRDTKVSRSLCRARQEVSCHV